MKLTKGEAIEILGLTGQIITGEVLKSAYHKCARQNHPDIPENKGREETMKQGNEAYDLLDCLLKEGIFSSVSDDYSLDNNVPSYAAPNVSFSRSDSVRNVWQEKAEADSKPMQFLYYMDDVDTGRHYDGFPLMQWQFTNILTGKIVEIYSSLCYEELTKMGIPCYPLHPNEIEKRQYIIWAKTRKVDERGRGVTTVNKADIPLEHIQFEYFNMRREMSSSEDTIKEMMRRYCISDTDPHDFGVLSIKRDEDAKSSGQARAMEKVL